MRMNIAQRVFDLFSNRREFVIRRVASGEIRCNAVICIAGVEARHYAVGCIAGVEARHYAVGCIAGVEARHYALASRPR